MPLILSVPKLLEMSDGGVPEGMIGILSTIYPRKAYGSGEKSGFVQKGVLTGDGKSIAITFWELEEIPQARKGKEIVAVSTRNQRGLSGLRRKDNEYKGKVTPEIHVQHSADVSYPDPAGGDTPQPQPESKPAANTKAPPPSSKGATTPPAHPQNGAKTTEQQGWSNYLSAKRSMVQYRNLQLLCIDAVYSMRPEIEAKHGVGTFTLELVQSLVAQNVIQANRDNVTALMPTAPIDAAWIEAHKPKK
jgi:hypothetical protein